MDDLFRIVASFAGTVFAARGEHLLIHKGYGKANIEDDINNDVDTVFRIASITKTFTAIAAMQLVEHGQLNLDEPIASFFPEQTGSDLITIHHLLTHTSGIVDYINTMPEVELQRWLAVKRSKADIMNHFIREPLAFQPGSTFSYSNSGYFLLGLIIEQLSGMMLDAYFNEYIFQPSNMENSFADALLETNPHYAHGYEEDSSGTLRKAPYVDLTNTFASGSILSTARDLYQLCAALRSGKLLSEHSLQRMMIPHADAGEFHYGYGLAVQQSPYGRLVGHSGGIHGYSSIFLHYIDVDLTVIVLSNICKPVDEISRHIAEIAQGT